MRVVSVRFLSVLIGAVAALPANSQESKPSPIHGLSMQRIDGKAQSLGEYKGRIALVVNVASECGFTQQYEGLQKLYQKYASSGFVVLGFPSNDFGKQEPGSNEDIFAFCRDTYGVTFPLFAKIAVAGDDASPLYRYLQKESESKAPVKWNFHKFLLDREGNVIGSFGSKVTPEDPKLVAAIEAALTKDGSAASKPAAGGPRLELVIVAFDGLPLPDGTTFSSAVEKEKRAAAIREGRSYVPPASIAWLPYKPGGTWDQEGEFLYYDPQFWNGQVAGFTAADLKNARTDRDRIGQRTVNVSVREAKRDAFERYTTKWIGHPLAVVLDGQILMTPTIKSPLKESIEVSNPGGLTEAEQQSLIATVNQTK
jgi:glutathione peroxidase